MIRLKVKEMAKEKGMGMGKLSRMADLSYRTVKLIYSDPYREVTTTTLDKIATALGVRVEELLETVTERREGEE